LPGTDSTVVVLANLGQVQLDPQFELFAGTTPLTASCFATVTTSVDSTTRTLPTQSVSVGINGTADYDSPVVVNGGGPGQTITVHFNCNAVVATIGATLKASVTAIS
jgi:hypothetical protein